eukprot:6387639-Prymnesium_polylepis.1
MAREELGGARMTWAQTSLITALTLRLPMIIADPIDRIVCRCDQLLSKAQSQDSYFNWELRNAETEVTA